MKEKYMKDFNGEKIFSLEYDKETLKDMVRQTVFATAQADAQKPILTGLLFDVEPDNVKVVGVDGYRLAVRKQILNLGKTMSFVISAKTIGEVVKIIFLMELAGLEGRKKLEKYDVASVVCYEGK